MEGSAQAALAADVRGFPVVLTSFVGRAGAVRAVAGLLERYRLVTVTGPGGVGKTRLAGEVARLAAARFADGAWLAELAPVRDPARVPPAVAVALGVREQPGVPAADAVMRVLARRQLLLVLDNCEHVIGAAAQLCAGLLQACDDVRILATSREPLRIAGEAAYRLAPLPVPGPGDAGDDGAGADAVALFADRARAADAGFALTGQNRADVARLVGRLDGMPLAIELAAARAEALGVAQLAGLLDGRLALLAGGDRLAAGRHRSLAAAAQWSYQLLADEEQRVFRLLSVFPAPFTLEAAGAVGGEGAVPAVLRLVECSLLVPPRPGPDGRSRYAMLETLRGYGAGLLAGAGEQDQAQAALARYALRVAEEAGAGMLTATGEPAAARWLDAEDAMMGPVLAWAVEHDLDVAARLVTALGDWWELRGRLAGQEPLLRELAGRAGPGSDGWCAAQHRLTWIAFDAADLPQALQRCAAIIDVIGDREPSRSWWTAWRCSRRSWLTSAGSRRRPHPAAAPWPWPASSATGPARSVPRRAWSSGALVYRPPGRGRPAGPAKHADPGHPRREPPGARLPAGRGAGRRGGPGRRRAGLRRDAGPGPGRRRPDYPRRPAEDHGGAGPAGWPHRRRRRAPARGSPALPANRGLAHDLERPGGLRAPVRRDRAPRQRGHRMGRRGCVQSARRHRGPRHGPVGAPRGGGPAQRPGGARPGPGPRGRTARRGDEHGHRGRVRPDADRPGPAAAGGDGRAGQAQPPGTGTGHPGRRGPHRRADRRAAVHQHPHRPLPPGPDPGQDRLPGGAPT